MTEIKYQIHRSIIVKDEESYRLADELFLRALLTQDYRTGVVPGDLNVITRSTYTDGVETQVAVSFDGAKSWKVIETV